jgi:trimethyllysine dioxygenase
MMRNVKLGGTRLTVEWDASEHLGVASTSEFPYHWLRDHCRCSMCFNAQTNQRQVDTFECGREQQSQPLAATKVEAKNDTLEVQFPSHTASYPLSWLKRNKLPIASLAPTFPFKKVAFGSAKKLWNDGTLDMPQVAYDDYMEEPEAEKMALRGLEAYGLLLVKGAPIESMDGTELFGKKLGHFIAPTLYGTMWSTHASRQEGSMQDTAYGSDALECHTDCTYLRESPGIQVFTCAVAADKGGHNRFVDGYHVVEQLSNEAMAFFATHAVPFGCNDDGFDLRNEVPMIQGHAEGDTFVVDHFRHNDYDRRPLNHWDAHTVEAFYEHHAELMGCIRRPDMERELLLNPGDMILVDNHRVMHGRYGFEGKRVLLGCYLNRDYVDSRIRTVTATTN